MRDSGTNHQEGHDTSAFFIKVTRDDYEDDLSADPPYDPFDSDCDLEKPTPKPARSKSREPGRLTREAYVGMCQCLKTIPLREVSKQFGKEKMCLRKAILGPRDLKAISTALLSDTYCRVLDLSGIFMDLKMVQYMCMMLNENITIRELNVADNRLSGEGLKCMAHAIKENGVIKTLNVSGNGLRDSDSIHIADIIANGTSLQRLNISHNELREDAGKIIGDVLGPNKNLRELDLSWNHIRCRGAIDLAKCLEKNTCLVKLNVGWNGFAYGGSLAMGETLATNTTLIDLDISCNRIHPPALIQLLKGLVKNKTLIKLNLSDNPIPVPFTGVILAAIRDSPNMVLTYLDLDGIIVDEEFLKILEVLESRRLFEVRYEAALPLNQYKRNRILEEFDKKDDVFSLDPIEMLYTLKEKMRAVDFFSKLDKDKKNTVTKVELHKLFKESGIPVTSASVDKAMEFIDFKRDGVIDLEEFIEADKKIKRHARAKAAKRAEQATLSTEKENRFSQSFRGADFNGTTSRVELTVDKEGRSIVEAAKTKDTLAPLPEKGPPLRNGLLKPLSARRRSSVSHLYGNDRRSSIGGNLFTNWSIPDEFDFD